ncbi:sulfotransferase family cytosolic 2B member 1 [Microcaecilia unicolor]|uniref:Sulfotransferase n=1 Tax=Microcaecilia unicolor TaxID=1415580 RepID=A0A6P7XMA5_9AMPH|nr:sulfotransferase family cytosolic 2B member 1-like [Microcaecilia unicolor]
MAKTSDQYFLYDGIPFPCIAHNEESLDFARNMFQVCDDDVYSITYPKSGTTWMQELLTLIYSNGDQTLSRSVPNWERVPWIEQVSAQMYVPKLTSPRLITSHLPLQLFPKSFFTSKAKVIYTMRNPKDVCVSLYHYCQLVLFLENPQDFDVFLSSFLEGDVLLGSWFDHVQSWLGTKDQVNILFQTYEELLQDLRGSVVRICNFLGKELDEAAIDSVVENATFKTMKDNKMTNYSLVPSDFMDHEKGSFLRKGISGDWKNQFTEAQSERFDQIYQEKMKEMKGLESMFTWDKP